MDFDYENPPFGGVAVNDDLGSGDADPEFGAGSVRLGSAVPDLVCDGQDHVAR